VVKITTLIKNADIRTLTSGILVSRASTASGNTPLANSATTIFTVSGGRILLKYLVGTVTTVIQSQATTVQFISTPTAGTAVNLSNSTGDLNGKEVGASVTLATTLGGTAVVNNHGANVLAQPPHIVDIGNITVTMGAASTGALKYDLIYVPLDAAAQVVAGT
jgi:hypothetical protein